MINIRNIEAALQNFKGCIPFDHCVVDNFFSDEFASKISDEFLDYDSDKWFYYRNPIENKKALNDWNVFPPYTYKSILRLQSEEFVQLLSAAVGERLYADHGLHGGGWHIHGPGGNLNPHLDYSIHPKAGLQRRLNIIIYLSKELDPKDHGGHLGLWSHDPSVNRPQSLEREIEPLFNRAVIFDTTQNSWHGMSRPLTQPARIYRKSLAIYYLCQPSDNASQLGRALFACRENQIGNAEIEETIRLRSDVDTSSQVYITGEK